MRLRPGDAKEECFIFIVPQSALLLYLTDA